MNEGAARDSGSIKMSGDRKSGDLGSSAASARPRGRHSGPTAHSHLPTCETRVVAVVAISLPSRGCYEAQTSK